MTHPNPNITEAHFCVLVMKSNKGNFSEGFTVVGPFDTEEEAAKWGDINIAKTDFDNPHWVVAPMTSVIGQ